MTSYSDALGFKSQLDNVGQVACTLHTSAAASLTKGVRAARRAMGKWDGKVTGAQQARRGEGLGSCSASSTSSQAEGPLPLPAPWPRSRSLQEFISTRIYFVEFMGESLDLTLWMERAGEWQVHQNHQENTGCP